MKTPLRILHLEDDPMDAQIIHGTLRKENIEFDVQCVDSSDAFKSALDRGGFDLIISDFKIPSFDGFSALEIARKQHPGIPFIFVSATIGEDRAIDAVKLGATDYVLKDRLKRLGPAVRRALAETEERRKRLLAEKKSLESEKQFRLIAENMTDLFAVHDLDGRRTYSSPSYATLLGPLDFVPGADSFVEVHPDDRARIRKMFDETVRTGKGQRSEYRLMGMDKTVRYIESQGSVIMGDDGNPEKVILVSRDITDRKKLEDQLLHSQKMESIGTLAGGLAHDFNNVLGIILGYLSLLSMGKTDPEKLSNSISAMHTAVKRGANLVRQLLAFARKSEVVFEPAQVNDTIKEIVEMCTQTFPKTISLSLNLDPQIPPILADSNQLHQALLNLLVNARDAMPVGGGISLNTTVVDKSAISKELPEALFDKYVRVSIADTGAGMDAATMARMFEPFFTTKGVGKGTGLGLAMVYGVINSHRGMIDVKSTPGKGTTFNLFFPVLPENATTLDPPEEKGRETAGGTETILLVEDEDAQVVLVKTLLEDFGYCILVAKDGIEAVELFKKHNEEIDLVLTDLGLPRLGGWDAFLKMKEIDPQIEAIVATGYVDAKSRSTMLKSGARDFLEKPYTPKSLLKKVRDALDALKPS